MTDKLSNEEGSVEIRPPKEADYNTVSVFGPDGGDVEFASAVNSLLPEKVENPTVFAPTQSTGKIPDDRFIENITNSFLDQKSRNARASQIVLNIQKPPRDFNIKGVNLGLAGNLNSNKMIEVLGELPVRMPMLCYDFGAQAEAVAQRIFESGEKGEIPPGVVPIIIDSLSSSDHLPVSVAALLTAIGIKNMELVDGQVRQPETAGQNDNLVLPQLAWGNRRGIIEITVGAKIFQIKDQKPEDIEAAITSSLVKYASAADPQIVKIADILPLIRHTAPTLSRSASSEYQPLVLVPTAEAVSSIPDKNTLYCVVSWKTVDGKLIAGVILSHFRQFRQV